ncbi:alpha/beta fold hydrolase [Oceanospirillum sediminis]|uniref:Alpha/beta hydrolase n=1 Tax=Oceanospirillum sediminis TaxID=2760088 RepID=A0A839IRQ5_9GAMM|nr:alpha/beta hydrolase [Oceanospirillum sediminis]MBB1487360.1 alpha/beta hydrolase [Oceanospirillum sediminis]
MSTRFKTLLSGMTLSFAMTGTSIAAQPAPEVIFVHGAHFTAQSWAALQNRLDGQISSHAVELPGRNDQLKPSAVSLDISAASLCQFMAKISGDKMLVAHSQGGAIVNASLGLCPGETITDIVYITAVAPLNKTKVFSLLSEKDDEYYYSGVKYNESSDLLEISDQDNFVATFAQDATASQKKALLEVAVNEPGSVGASKVKLNEDRFNQIDKYYVYAKEDKIISFESQKKIAATLDLKNSYEIDSGHLPMLTRVNQLADILLNIYGR